MQIEFDLSRNYSTVRQDQCDKTITDLRVIADIFEKILTPASEQVRKMLTRLGHDDQVRSLTFQIKRGLGFVTDIAISIKIDDTTELKGSCSILDMDLKEGKFTADNFIIAVLKIFTLHYIETLTTERTRERNKKPAATA